MYTEILPELIIKNDKKAILLVADGVAGCTVNGITELDAATTPNLDALAAESSLGLHYPVGYGITPGSGPGHLALFGYDPIKNQIGRGVLEAFGVGMDVPPGHLALRGNFATLKDGIIVDRRADRISTEKNLELVQRITEDFAEIDGVRVEIKTVKEHRFAVVFHGVVLFDNVTDADPLKDNLPPVKAVPRDKASVRSAYTINNFIERVTRLLANEEKANTCLLRGASNLPDIQNFEDRTGLRGQAIAAYPMYKGLARLVKMVTPDGLNEIEKEVEHLKKTFKKDLDFHFVHYKPTDSSGEDGDFDKKVAAIEAFDKIIPDVLETNPDVLVITGDHSTPSSLSGHGWHGVPVLIHGEYAFADDAKRFTERSAANHGILGHIPGQAIMMYILANCGRLSKFGA